MTRIEAHPAHPALTTLPPLPGVDPRTAPELDDPAYCDWLESVVFSPEGVDRALLWESLHLSPAERLRRLQEYVDAFYAAAPPLR